MNNKKFIEKLKIEYKNKISKGGLQVIEEMKYDKMKKLIISQNRIINQLLK